MSLMRNKISDLPDVLECPKLKILLLQYNKITLSCSHEFFSGMKALKVLDLSQDFYLPFHNPIRHPNAFNDLTSKMMDEDPAVEVAVALGAWPRLKVLTISIPNIVCIPKDVVFPELENGLNVLEHLSIEDCSQFEYLINTEEWGISSHAQPPDLELLFNLEQLKLVKLDTFKGICLGALTTSTWTCFPKLRSDREEMEEIVAKKNEGQEERVDKMMFKSLKKIKLEHLPMLSGFYTGDFPFECPSLEELIVRDCPKMKTSAATTPKLKAAILDNFEKTLQGMDLNQVVQNHFKAKLSTIKKTELLPMEAQTASESDLRNNQLYLNGSSFNAHLLACVPTEGATSLLVNRLEDMENIIPNLQADVDGLNFEYLIYTEEWGISPQEQPPDLQLLFNLEESALWKLDTFKGICVGSGGGGCGSSCSTPSAFGSSSSGNPSCNSTSLATCCGSSCSSVAFCDGAGLRIISETSSTLDLAGYPKSSKVWPS
ncbi:hypothetical protein HYC85_018326 [Camellia sinensis]|uniref:Uncharacterized protein n=1 Tax=Camellia sinensis TaxID=4442 RepID=A0A7J7GU09_CAMSI|nr:hypothetical protein HYC85_018326 [Camellia sinensis]